MNDLNTSFLNTKALPDVQGSDDARSLAIERVGIRGIKHPIQVQSGSGSFPLCFGGKADTNFSLLTPLALLNKADWLSANIFWQAPKSLALPIVGISSTTTKSRVARYFIGASFLLHITLIRRKNPYLNTDISVIVNLLRDTLTIKLHVDNILWGLINNKQGQMRKYPSNKGRLTFSKQLYT